MWLTSDGSDRSHYEGKTALCIWQMVSCASQRASRPDSTQFHSVESSTAKWTLSSYMHDCEWNVSQYVCLVELFNHIDIAVTIFFVYATYHYYVTDKHVYNHVTYFDSFESSSGPSYTFVTFKSFQITTLRSTKT